MLEMYAQHGSVSHGPIGADRLKAILLGDSPDSEEYPRVWQSLMEMPGSHAFDLASEIGVSYRYLNERTRELFGEGLPQ